MYEIILFTKGKISRWEFFVAYKIFIRNHFKSKYPFIENDEKVKNPDVYSRVNIGFKKPAISSDVDKKSKNLRKDPSIRIKSKDGECEYSL